MSRSLSIPWLRIVPRRIPISDATGRRIVVAWLDPGDPQRDALPPQTREGLDAAEFGFKPTAWGRYSLRTLVPVLVGLFFTVVVIGVVGWYGMFPRRSIIGLFVIMLAVLPMIVVGLAIGGRVWVKRTGAAARINACLYGGRCPACLAEIDSLTARPVDTVRCACAARWPTLGALQAGGRSVRAATVVTRTTELAWLVPLGLLSLVLTSGFPLIPPANQVIGATAAVFLLWLFAPVITRGRRSFALHLGLAVGTPPLLVMLWILFRQQVINLPLLIGGVAAFGACATTGYFFVPRTQTRPGWHVGRYICEACGYDLRGASTPEKPLSTCPECGAAARAPGVLQPTSNHA